MKSEMQIKQYIGKVFSRTSWGTIQYFQVFTTGNPKFLLFCQLDKTGTFQTGLHIPTRKSDLRRDWRKNMVA